MRHVCNNSRYGQTSHCKVSKGKKFSICQLLLATAYVHSLNTQPPGLTQLFNLDTAFRGGPLGRARIWQVIQHCLLREIYFYCLCLQGSGKNHPNNLLHSISSLGPCPGKDPINVILCYPCVKQTDNETEAPCV